MSRTRAVWSCSRCPSTYADPIGVIEVYHDCLTDRGRQARPYDRKRIPDDPPPCR